MTDARQHLITRRAGRRCSRGSAPKSSRGSSRFGEPCSYRAGDVVARVGDGGIGLIVVMSGQVEVTQNDSGQRVHIVTHERGNFMGELAQLSGRPYLVDATALTDVEAIAIPPERLRALLIAEADLGERIMRALILRRVGLIEAGAGPIIVGRRRQCATCFGWSISCAATAIPTSSSIPPTTRARQTLVERFQVAPEELPIVLCPGGQLLRNPSEGQLARCVGLVGPDRSRQALRCRDHRRRSRRPRHRRLCRHRKACRCWRSTAARSAARPAPRRGSRITSASRPAFPAWR